jgi:hypothetical protein
MEYGITNYSFDEYEKDIYNAICYIPFFTGVWFGTVPQDELIDKNFPYFFIIKTFRLMEMMNIQTIMGEFGSKTKEGEMVTVQVARKNAEGKEEIVKLTAPAILVEVKQKNVLKLAENPTAEQLKLRKAWLAKP